MSSWPEVREAAVARRLTTVWGVVVVVVGGMQELFSWQQVQWHTLNPPFPRPYIVYMLRDIDIMEDWTAIKKVSWEMGGFSITLGARL